MDQVRKLLAMLGKYHFWILVVMAMLLVVVGRYLAASSLTEQTEANRKAIEQKFTSLNQISAENPHPNDRINEGIDKLTEEQRQGVERVWSDLYNKQKEEVLKWPLALGKDFVRDIEGDENHKPLRFGEPLKTYMRERYQNYVKDRFEELPDIVKAAVSRTGRSTAGRRQLPGGVMPFGQRNLGAPAAGEQQTLVTWADYGQIADKLFWEQTPASLEVWIVQEDLWVYETLLWIIARTNDGATGPHDAVVKVIQSLQVGQDAAAGSRATGLIQRSEMPSLGGRGGPESGKATGGPLAGAGRSEEMDREAGGSPYGERGFGRPGGGRGADPEARAAMLKQDRYLDETGQPLAEDAAGPVDQFKRLPVRMELEMDVREIPRLLAECANATLPVEVRQVRINASTTGGYGRRSGARRGGYSRGGGGFDEEEAGEFMPSRRAPARSGGTTAGQLVPNPAVVPVTIQGIIYIFNPPDREALGLPAGEPPVADAATPQPAS